MRTRYTRSIVFFVIIGLRLWYLTQKSYQVNCLLLLVLIFILYNGYLIILVRMLLIARRILWLWLVVRFLVLGSSFIEYGPALLHRHGRFTLGLWSSHWVKIRLASLWFQHLLLLESLLDIANIPVFHYIIKSRLFVNVDLLLLHFIEWLALILPQSYEVLIFLRLDAEIRTGLANYICVRYLAVLKRTEGTVVIRDHDRGEERIAFCALISILGVTRKDLLFVHLFLCQINL